MESNVSTTINAIHEQRDWDFCSKECLIEFFKNYEN